MAYKQKLWSGWSPIKQKNTQEYTEELEKESTAYKGQMPASRKGVRKSPDGSYSTHIMTYGSTGDSENLKYHAWPTLFQDDEGEWYEGGFEEAKRKGEIRTFKTEKEAEAFAGGNWKKEHDRRKEIDILEDIGFGSESKTRGL